MTLRELKNLHILSSDIYIYLYRSNGSEEYILKFDHKVKMNNLEKCLNDSILNKEIHFIQPEENAIIVYFKEN